MTVQVAIQKSPIPIVWLDTSIITYMTQWEHKIGNLEQTMLGRVSRLYEQIYKATRSGKLICPLAEQEAEIWVERDKWLETMHSLALGIETAARQSVQDKQLNAFMTAHAQGYEKVFLDYKDAFLQDPIEELRDTLRGPVCVYVKSDILFGKDYAKGLKNTLLTSLNEQREKNVKSGITFEKQLEAEYMGELQALTMLGLEYFSGQFKNEHGQLNAICGAIDLNRKLSAWEAVSSNPSDFQGLIQFYKSKHYRSMPYTDISCNLMARLMIDKQMIRSGDNMDIHHVSTMMPYSNLFITDKAMSTFLRKKKFDLKYKTTVCYIGDTQVIDSFFGKL